MSDGSVRHVGVRHADDEDVRGPLWEEAVAAGAARGAVVPAGVDASTEEAAEPHAAGNLRRYARWQWRDFWRRRGGWLALGALLGVSLLVLIARLIADEVGSRLAGDVAKTFARTRGVAELFFTLGGAAAALIGVGGLVSRERERGLQRFLFAKPVRPVRYYLQALAINSAGALLVWLGAVLLGAAILGAAVPVGSVLAAGIAAYVLTAGATFLASTLVRFDAPVAAVWLLAGFPVYGAARLDVPGAGILSWLFPQGWAFTAVRAAGLPAGGAISIAVVAVLAVAYGLLAFAGGVAVLRRRAIST